MSHLYGLLGRNISYSRSPEIHRNLWGDEGADKEYRLFDVDDIEGFVREAKTWRDLRGFNVTIPYKEEIIRYIDQLEGDAQAIGAVNTVKCVPSENGLQWIGYNTDVAGFETLLEEVRVSPDVRAIILGTGGASKAVVQALTKQAIHYVTVSRTPSDRELSYADLSDILQTSVHKLIINATPLGSHQFPDIAPPIPYSLLTPSDTLIDLIYSPAETPFMQQGREQGAKVSNGLTMLWTQAREAQAIWAK
ncbi:shikimate dehydrogenase [Porphyromonas sp.]|uniref:shikimate dehydrogenase family protein n=1 Tax=Porphyromonas sp. TaxID=1924944 RepID=UPI0026DCEC8F|nr:shikimate dehydrogenase [Porphyromonas sp.]MDO4771418.1 shikimate dehydrogenase [Porphyromonas sp.]